MNLSDSFEGSASVVTGAAGAIGRCITQRLLALGSIVVAIDLDGSAVRRLAHELDHTDHLVPVVADVANADAWRSVQDALVSVGRPPAFWVNNAGVLSAGEALDVDVAEWDRVLAINLTSVLLGSQTAIRLMTPQRAGSIVNISSFTGFHVQRGRAAYGVSKAGIAHLTRFLAVECAPDGIRVNAVAPGSILTPMSNWHSADLHERERILDAIPLGRLGSPEEVAGVVLLLGSSLSSYVTGQTIRVDGGRGL